MNEKPKKTYTKADLLRQLADMNIPRGGIVLMHSSLRSVGRVEGGAETLLDAMIEYFTEQGGLFCVPTHTWRNIGKDVTLDLSDPSTCLGAFSDLAAADARGVRSLNPTHSMAVFGDREKAVDFIKDDEHVTICTAPESCYGKLYREGGYVLLVGVSHNKNTYLHCVEEMIGIEGRLSKPLDVKVRLATGELISRQLRLPETAVAPDISARYPQYETAFRYHGAIVDGWIGNAPTQCCDARLMKEIVELIWKNNGKADVLANENAISPKLYC